MKKLAGSLGLFAVLVVSAPLARANYVLSYSVTGVPGATQCAAPPSDTLASCFAAPTFIGGAAGITITQFTGTSNSPGTPGLSRQTGSVVDIITTGPGTLDLWLGAPDFTNPSALPLIDTTSLTIIPTFGIGSANLANCVDLSNGTVPPPPLPGTAFCVTPAGGTPVLNSATYSGTTSLASNNHATLTSISTPFSLSEHIVIAFTTASEIEIQTRQVLSAVPEPASIILLGTTTLGLISLLRKKVANRA